MGSKRGKLNTPIRAQNLDFAFEAKGVDERTCSVEGMPRFVPAGQQFDLRVRLRDVYRNGLPGLEPSLQLEQEVAGQGGLGGEGEIIKVSGEDLGRGRYSLAFKIRRASERLCSVCLRGGGKIIQRAVVEVRKGTERRYVRAQRDGT
jgi:hypothetical protein